MIPFKLLNADAHKITITSTATSLLDLMRDSAGASNNLPSYINAVDLVVEDGDIRYIQDNTPTATTGMLVSQGTVLRLRNVNLKKLNLIRVGSADVAVSVSVGQTSRGEVSNAYVQGGDGVFDDLTVNGDLTVKGDFIFGDATSDTMTVNGIFRVTDGSTKYVQIIHDGTNGEITSNSGDLYITPGSDDIFAGDGSKNVRMNYAGLTLSSMAWRDSGLSARAQMIAHYTLAQMALLTASNVGNQLVMAPNASENYDFEHDAETDFALYIHASGTDNTKYIKLQYDSTNDKGILDVGNGYLQISPTTNGEGLNFANEEITTTDATETTASTLATQSDRTYHVTTYVVATETTDHDESASYVIHGTFKNDGGTLTAIGTTSQTHIAEDTTSWDASYDVSGTDIRVRVTGAASTNIRWHVTSQYTSIQ